MSRIETSISGQYVPSWGLAEGLRELIANALDAELRWEGGVGRASVGWSPAEGGSVFIQNWGITCPVSFWLMGDSESRDHESAIGQFGEGGPLGCLALVRGGHKVTMDNGPVRWSPELAPSAKFGGKTVLTVKTRKLRKERPGFEITVTGVSREQYDRARSRFLSLKGFDPQQTTGFWEERMTTAQKPGVLLDPAEKGRVFVKGCLVAERNDLLFGYNLDIEELNRDRNSIDEDTVASSVRAVLEKGCRHSEAILASVVHAALGGWSGDEEPLEVRSNWGPLAWSDSLTDRMVESFLATHGEDAVVVDSDSEQAEAEKYGLTPIRLSRLGKRAVERRLGDLSTRVDAAKKAVIKTYSSEELHPLTRNNLKLAALLSTRGGEPLDEIRVVEFRGRGISVFTHDPEVGEVLLVEKGIAQRLPDLLAKAMGRNVLAVALAESIDGQDPTLGMLLMERSIL